MATGTARPGNSEPPPRPRPAGRVIEYQKYIDVQVGKTRARVKWIDLWTSLTMLVIGVLAYLLTAAIIDHTLTQGLGFTGRLLLLLGLLAGIVLHLAVGFLPYLVRRVNPVYAAAAIERSNPLKNTLVNFLLLRRRPEGVPEPLLDALKEQAAVRLSTVPGDAMIDRSSLIRWGVVLTVTLLTATVYALVAPKNTFRSVRRVISPWADIAAPTRVEITSVAPGDVTADRDDTVEIVVQSRQARDDDEAFVFFSATADEADDDAAPLTTEDRYHWRTVLPPNGDGLKQDLFYYVRIGDAVSPRYRIRVLSTPVINVARVRYEYPAYTELPPRTVERQGDVKGLEGTRVVLEAEANQPIASAHAAFDRFRSKDVPLTIDSGKLRAEGAFELALRPDRTAPVHTSYLLRFTNLDGAENPKPVEHKIEVTADQGPELKLVEPTTPPEQEISLAMGGLLRISLEARDPDFKLADLSVVFERAGAPLRNERLLPEPRYGPFSNTLVFEPGRFGLKPGDRVRFFGRAADNKQPQPNVVETKRYTIFVAAGAGQPPQPREGAPQPRPNDDRPNGTPQDGQPQNGQPQNGTPQPGRPQPNDGQPQNGSPQNGQPQSGPSRPGAEGNTPPMPGDGRSPPQPGEQRPNDSAKPPQPGERRNDAPSQPGANEPPGAKPEPQANQEPEQPVDPKVDPGRAFEELKRHFDEQDRKAGKPSPDDQNRSGKQSRPLPNNQPQSGDGPKNPGGEQKPGSDTTPNGGNEGRPPPQPSGDGPSGSKPAAPKTDGGPNQPMPGAEGASPKKPDANGDQPPKNGNPKAGEPQPGEPKNDGAGRPMPGSENPAQQPGNPQAGEKSGDSPSGKPQPNGGMPNSGNPAPKNDAAPSGSGDSGEAGGAAAKSGSKPEGKPSTGNEPNASPSSNQGNPAGAEKNTGGERGSAQPREGSPDAQEMSKPRDKQGAPKDGTGQESTGDAPKSPSGSRHESQAEGQTSGDRSGKGEEGGGQKSSQKGTGAAGTNTPGDRGAGAAPEGGDSATSADGGDKRPGNTPSGGKPGENAGNGSTTRNGGEQPGGEGMKPGPNDGSGAKPAAGGKPGEAPVGEGADPQNGKPDDGPRMRRDQGSPGDVRAPASDPAGNAQRGDLPKGEGAPTAGPGQGDNGPTSERDTQLPSAAPEPGGDEANLEYTKKVTDLTIDRLKNGLDKGEVDPELIKRFGSREVLEQFVRRWDELRRATEQPGPPGDAARRRFEETLKSLGLRPQSTAQTADRRLDDADRNLRGARRTAPPPKFADQYRAYTTGVGQPPAK